jgi:hypothetical protein
MCSFGTEQEELCSTAMLVDYMYSRRKTMADEIIRMEDIYADDIVGNINEVREARGTFESLDARLDNIDGNAPSPSTSDPAMDGTASPGSADTYSRGDHVHPTDTSRQAVIDSSHKLSSDLVYDTNNTNKFATAAQLQQITTNETNISSILDGTTIDSFGDVETALSGKQATLTTAQLAAVNSGIDSTKVAQIETNKTNILSLLPTSYSLPTLIDGTTCTINEGGYITVGNIIVVNVTFTTSASYTAYSSIMQFPAPKNSGSITMVAAAHIDSSVNVAVNKYGQIALFDTPLPAGTYHFFTVYLKQ